MKRKCIQQMLKIAYTDVMTGTLNRNAYERRLNNLRKESADLRDITVIAVDINDLKKLNDTYGHQAGDEALKTVAEFLLTSIGESAEVYRIGGDEFVCIAFGKIGGYISEFKDLIGFRNKEVPYTLEVSVGYKPYDDSFESIDALINHCDKLMYEDKKHSRQKQM